MRTNQDREREWHSATREDRDASNDVLHFQVLRLLSAWDEGVMTAEEVCQQLCHDVNESWFDWLKVKPVKPAWLKDN
jgi:hypothetical protein